MNINGRATFTGFVDAIDPQGPSLQLVGLTVHLAEPCRALVGDVVVVEATLDVSGRWQGERVQRLAPAARLESAAAAPAPERHAPQAPAGPAEPPPAAAPASAPVGTEPPITPPRAVAPVSSRAQRFGARSAAAAPARAPAGPPAHPSAPDGAAAPASSRPPFNPAQPGDNEIKF